MVNLIINSFIKNFDLLAEKYKYTSEETLKKPIETARVMLIEAQNNPEQTYKALQRSQNIFSSATLQHRYSRFIGGVRRAILSSKKATRSLIEKSKTRTLSVRPSQNHEYLFDGISKGFAQRIQEISAESEKLRLTELEGRITHYVHENIDTMISDAKETGIGVTRPKAETGLPTLRCFFNKETGKPSLHISFGTFAQGGEAKIKDVFIIEEGRIQRTAQRSALTNNDPKKPKAEKEEVQMVRELAHQGVPGLAVQVPNVYRGGKGVIKNSPIAEKYPTDLNQQIEKKFQGLNKAKILPTKMAIASQLVATVCAMHRLGVIHRDLKPDNVLLTSNFSTALTDFGLTEKLSSHPRSDCATGSVGYLAPEALNENGVEATPAQDLWSLGVLLYELCFGRTALDEPQLNIQDDILNHKDPTAHAKDLKQKVDVMKMVLSKSPMIPREFGAIVSKLLEMDPAQRLTDEQLDHEFTTFFEAYTKAQLPPQ